MSSIDDEAVVRASLRMAGIEAEESEIVTMTVEYAKTRASMRRFYSLSDVRYEEPAVTFDPLP